MQIGRRSLLLLAVCILGLVGLRIAEPKPLRQLQNLGFDLMQGMAPHGDVPSSFTVVNIGERSLDNIGPWPWRRDALATLVDRLHDLGAVAVVLPLLLDTPDRFSAHALLERLAGEMPPADHAELAERLAHLPDPDEALASALARLPTALGTAVRIGAAGPPEPGPAFGIPSRTAIPPEVPRFEALTVATPGLHAAARAEGAVNLVPEEDMVLRRAALFFLVGDVMHPSLAVAGLVAGGREVAFARHPDGGYAMLVDGAARRTSAPGIVWLDFGRRTKIPVLEAQSLDADAMDRIHGRIVVLGLDVAGIGRPLRLADGSLASEPEIIAMMGDALDIGSVLSRPLMVQAIETVALAVGMAVIGVVWLATAPGLASLVTLALGIGWVAVVAVARMQAGLVVDLACPLVLSTMLATVSAGLRTARLWQIRRELVTELQSRTRAAEAANEAKTRFLHEMHHDLRTPLNAVLGLSGLLKGSGLARLSPQQITEFATTIHDAGAQVLHLSEQALQAAEYATEHATPNLQIVDLGEALVKAGSIMLGNRQRTASLDLHIDPAPHFILADPTQLLEAVLNLLDNAFKHAEGTETVILASEPLGNGRIAIDILDEGPGIDESILEHVGTPFPSERAAHDGVRGAGLGLFIAQRFAKTHGGHLRLGKRPGGGWRCRLELDLVGDPKTADSRP
ncbi:hypothetical protein LNKW23_30300 [Paralimibaculum aggregatum]|uniref:histidine kinase n=1 Tax=Paralimibaculum aggregatum TaxID=3036245 RepID=A0ABQ6LMX2_9RHOB|nr:CHASE2 and HATPase_c domain-containing protein [Limibaculum sp. NKW23]GMG83816.1 hypothetical protein LNKW23_30300 [Limibaculum sp. NKW23]